VLLSWPPSSNQSWKWSVVGVKRSDSGTVQLTRRRQTSEKAQAGADTDSPATEYR